MSDRPQLLTVREYAVVERVDVSTVRRWIAKGALVVRRTPGGGIRIPATAPPKSDAPHATSNQ
jgi:excisionase family DNA binding protein